MATELWGQAGHTVEGQLTTFNRRLLSRFRAENKFNKYGKQDGIPKNGGKSISFRRMEIIWPAGNVATFGAQASAGSLLLTEGTPPAATNATWSEVLATVSQYGQYSLISDLAADQSIDDVVPEYTENYSESMRDCLDLVSRDVLVAGTNVQYASTAGSRGGVGSGMYLSLAELRRAKRTLKKANAKPIRKASSKFVVLTNPDAVYDLEGDTNISTPWQNAGARGEGNQVFDVTYQDLPNGFRLEETTLARVFASAGLSGADVIATLVLAEEAYGTIKLDAMPAEIIKKERGSAGTNDPLNQVASVGWKAAHTAVILNQANMVRIEHASSSKNAA
jgi:N4-gp56 family major capsid protein